MKKLLITIILLLLCVNIVYSVDFVPQGNIVGRNIYGIYNFTNIQASNITVSNINGYYNASVSNDTYVLKSGDTMTGSLNVSGRLEANSTSFPVASVIRTATSSFNGSYDTTAGIASGYSLRTVATGDMGDGFGGGIILTVQDNESSSSYTQGIMARIIGRRDGSDTTGLLQFFTSGANAATPSMTIRNSGNVGIGTTSPTEKLDVSGNVKISNNLTVNSNTFFVDGTNNKVGIGTTTPLSRLDVSDAVPTITIKDNQNKATWNTGDPIGNISFRTTDTSGIGPRIVGSIKMVSEINGGTTPSGALTFSTSLYNGNEAEAMRINNAGLVGIGTTSPTTTLTVNGAIVTNTTSAGGNTYQSVATQLYTQSRLLNLVTNGNGLMDNNYNFGTMTFDSSDRHGGGGSFISTVTQSVRTSDEFIPVDPSLTYKLSGWAKSGHPNGSMYNTSARQYYGLVMYDIDKLSILPCNSNKYSGSTDTYLTQPLNTGDTVMYLNNVTGWYNGATATYRHFAYYPYTDSRGYTYPNYTYTRYGTFSNTLSSGVTTSYYATFGAWNQSAIDTTNNYINLSRPWTGPNLSNGTAMRNGAEGNTYTYIAASNAVVPNTWTYYDGYIGKESGSNLTVAEEFRTGTAYVRLLFLVNYPSGMATNVIKWSDLSLTNVDTVYDVYANQDYDFYNEGTISLSIIDGNKVGVGVSTPVNKLDVEGALAVGATYSGTSTAPTNGAIIEGNVGIGTTSPNGKLETVSSSFPVGSFVRTTTETGGSLDGLTGIASGYSLRTITSGDMTDGFGGGIIISSQDDTSSSSYANGVMARIYARRDGADNKGALQFFTGGLDSASPSMTIRNSGNVGIGTTNPTQKLDVDGSVNISQKVYMPNIPGTGNYICFNTTDSSLYRGTSC